MHACMVYIPRLMGCLRIVTTERPSTTACCVLTICLYFELMSGGCHEEDNAICAPPPWEALWHVHVGFAREWRTRLSSKTSIAALTSEADVQGCRRLASKMCCTWKEACRNGGMTATLWRVIKSCRTQSQQDKTTAQSKWGRQK